VEKKARPTVEKKGKESSPPPSTPPQLSRTEVEPPSEGLLERSEVMKKMEELDLVMPPLFTEANLVAPDFSRMNGEYNQQYFKEADKGRGAVYLVAISSLKHYDDSVKIDFREIQLQLDIAKLVNTMSRNQKDLLGKVINGVIESTARRNNPSDFSQDRKFEYPELPRSGEDIRRLYWEGKNAMLNRVPRPPCTMLKAHAIVSVFDILTDFLGHGVPCRSIPSITWFKSQVELQSKKRKVDTTPELLTVKYV
jgi:hypothetical protein